MTVPVPPTGPTNDEKTWGMFAWLGALLLNFVGCGLGFIAPLVIMLTKGKDSRFVRANAVESLNIFITVSITVGVAAVFYFVAVIGGIVSTWIFLVGLMLTLLTVLCALAASIYGLVIAILGSVAANKGEEYRAPFAFRFVK